MPGSIGDIVFFPGRDGTFKDTQTATLDSGLYLRDLQAKQQENAAFETKKNDYNSKRTSYDDSIDKYTTREKDLFAKTFSPAVSIPERPT